MKLRQMIITILLLSSSLFLSGQQTLSFTFGESNQYLGNVRVSLILVGENISKNVSQVLMLSRNNARINLNKYRNTQLYLRVEDLEFSDNQQNFSFHLEAPIGQAIPEAPHGLRLQSSVEKIIVGSNKQRELPLSADLIYTPDDNLEDLLQGELPVDFNIVDKKGNTIPINTKLKFQYSIIPLGMELETDSTAEETSTAPVVADNNFPTIGEEKPTTDQDYELPDGGNKKEPLFYKPGLKEGEPGLTDKEYYTTESGSDYFKSPVDGSLYAEFNYSEEQLEIDRIENGKPAYALAFYPSEEFHQQIFTLELGSGRSYKVDLSKLPLKTGTYFVGLVDENGDEFQHGTPIKLTSVARAGIRAWPWKWIGVGIGLLVLIATLITLYIQKFA